MYFKTTINPPITPTYQQKFAKEVAAVFIQCKY